MCSYANCTSAAEDGITVQNSDGSIVQSKPDGDGGVIFVESQPEEGGDSNNQGNTKNRTGGNDKKDSKNTNSGGGGSCNCGGGGKHK